MLEDLPRDLMSKLGYRIAYGEAARLAEMARFDHGWGRDFTAQVGGEAEAIEQEVMRRVSHDIHPELVKLAVLDALEQCKPRWRGPPPCTHSSGLAEFPSARQMVRDHGQFAQDRQEPIRNDLAVGA